MDRPVRLGRGASPALVAGAALLLLVALAPPAQAQDQQPPVELRIVQLPDQLSPLAPATEFTLSVEYDCSRVHPTDGSTLTVEVAAAPEWIVLSGPTEATLDPDAQACLDNDLRAIRTLRWSAAASREAPAFTPADLTFNATVEFVDGEGSDQATEPIQAAFFSSLAVQSTEASKQARPGQTVGFNVTLINDGNGPVRVSFALDPGDGAEATAPDEVVVPSTATGASTDRATALVRASGALPEGVRSRLYDIGLTVSAVYAEDPSVAGDEVTMTLRLTVVRPALDQATPGPGGLVAAAALAGAALFVLRRRPRRPRA